MKLMTEKRKVLGRGLESLIPAARTAAAAVAAPAEGGEAVRMIPLREIAPSPYQPRLKMPEAGLEELAASIRISGVLQPIVVRPINSPGAGLHYQMIAGERRLLASKRAGKETIPALVRIVSDEQAMEMALIENLQREDLNPIEEAHAFERLMRECGLTQEQVAQKTGKDRASIANHLRLLRLPPEIQEGVAVGAISMGHAKALAALDSRSEIQYLAMEIAENGMSVRKTEELVRQRLEGNVPVEPQRRIMAPREVDPNVREVERELERILGVRVQIKDRKGKGKVVLEYYSLEDFDRILEVMGAKK
jgi:ParB family chromosome partitioning protein